MRNEQPGRLDTAIDRAVRRMVQVDPRPGLRRRVGDRLHAAPPRRWTPPTLLATAAIVAILAWSAALYRTTMPPEPSQPRVALASTAAAPAAVPAAPRNPLVSPDRRLSASPRRARTTAVATRRPAQRAEVIFGPAQDRVSAASVRPDVVTGRIDTPTSVAEMPDDFPQLPPIVITPISIAPIVVVPVTIRPLSERK